MLKKLQAKGKISNMEGHKSGWTNNNKKTTWTEGFPKACTRWKFKKIRLLMAEEYAHFGVNTIWQVTLFFLFETHWNKKKSVTKKYDSEKSQITKPHLWTRLYSFIVKLKAINISCDKSTKESKNTTYRKCLVKEWTSASKINNIL